MKAATINNVTHNCLIKFQINYIILVLLQNTLTYEACNQVQNIIHAGIWKLIGLWLYLRNYSLHSFSIWFCEFYVNRKLFDLQCNFIHTRAWTLTSVIRIFKFSEIDAIFSSILLIRSFNSFSFPSSIWLLIFCSIIWNALLTIDFFIGLYLLQHCQLFDTLKRTLRSPSSGS